MPIMKKNLLVLSYSGFGNKPSFDELDVLSGDM
jgi:hypothetical protein